METDISFSFLWLWIQYSDLNYFLYPFLYKRFKRGCFFYQIAWMCVWLFHQYFLSNFLSYDVHWYNFIKFSSQKWRTNAYNTLPCRHAEYQQPGTVAAYQGQGCPSERQRREKMWLFSFLIDIFFLNHNRMIVTNMSLTNIKHKSLVPHKPNGYDIEFAGNMSSINGRGFLSLKTRITHRFISHSLLGIKFLEPLRL